MPSARKSRSSFAARPNNYANSAAAVRRALAPAQRQALETGQLAETGQALAALPAPDQDPRTRLLENLHEVI